jgi:hypothetical protein
MNDADYKLLELAAKAAGELYTERAPEGGLYLSNGQDWNPLEDDGDALRLAVTLGINAGWYECCGYAIASAVPENGPVIRCEEYQRSPYAATRRAIVRAAAEIGKAM